MGDDFDGGDNIVEVYVRYLRNKIDKPFDRASLQTIRTLGYRLVDDRSVRRSPGWLQRMTASVRVRVARPPPTLFAVVLAGASMWLLHAIETRLTDRARRRTPSRPCGPRRCVCCCPARHRDRPRRRRHRRLGCRGTWFVTPDGVTVVAYRTEGEGAGAGTIISSAVAGSAEATMLPLDAFTAAELGVVNGNGPYVISTLAVNDQVSLAGVSSLAAVQDTIDSMRTLLWWIVPLLVLIVGALAWAVVGRALRPVHAVTQQVASIGSDSLHERVPVPQSGDEVGELATTMNSMLDRLESATLASRQLVSDASHELRTPIAVLRAELEVARRGEATDWEAVSVGMLDEVERLQGLVDDLLLLAQASERAMRTAPVDVVDVAAQVASRRREVPVEIDVDAVPPVAGDGVALVRAIDHLVANAARHASTRVCIGVHEVDGHVEVRVQDDGAGIAPADRERVLDRFVRLDEGRDRDAGGTGLGLAVAHDVVSAHGGTLTIGDSPLGGAEVIVALPAVRGVTALVNRSTKAVTSARRWARRRRQVAPEDGRERTDHLEPRTGDRGAAGEHDGLDGAVGRQHEILDRPQPVAVRDRAPADHEDHRWRRARGRRCRRSRRTSAPDPRSCARPWPGSSRRTAPR